MNSIILKCKVDAIRSRQIQLKREEAANREKLQKELDEMMEEERLRVVKDLEARDAARAEKLRMQKAMIRQQIAERQARAASLMHVRGVSAASVWYFESCLFFLLQLKRELELEERERERALILRQMEAMKLEDQQLKRQKEEAARRLQLEVNAHNQILFKEKKEREALELLEEEKIVQYNAERIAREKEQEAKRKQVEAAKQKGYAAICAKQDRELDRAAQLDALRARRAMQERERVERQKEEMERQKQKKINDELAQARLQQHREKMLKLVECAIAEKREFERMAASQRESARREEEKRQAETAKRLQLMQDLRKQIELRSLELEKLKLKQSEEAEALRQAEEESRRRVERARERKLAELHKLADSEKYIAQLRKVQCAK
ncbi:hypothetical protein Efla_005664 [Eimeria flavescens]